ncbi:MAG: hypothetical protein CSA36_04895 [Draconibacterium sp.]|nr:MAG: hypothetical protein CSA36_04895 [Draconibacterium sp.]
MKKLLIFTIIILAGISHTQTATAQFLNKEATWTVSYESTGDGYLQSIINVSIEKDSLINDTLYSIFNQGGNKYALREDSNKVYFRLLPPFHFPNADSSEHLLYDFGLEVNDSIRLNLLINEFYTQKFWKVTNVDSVLVGQEYKKRILLEYYDSSYPDFGILYWIEDLGSSAGPLYFTGISEFETKVNLYCYWVNNELFYCTESSNGRCKYLSPYYPVTKKFLDKGATWITVKYSLDAEFTGYSISKDTIINDTVYSIISDHYSHPVCAMREDGNKVFFRLLDTQSYPDFDGSEYLLYDFGLKRNDSIRLKIVAPNHVTNEYWKVVAVDSILLGEEYNKRIWLENPDPNARFRYQYWIEHIGSTEGLLYFTGISTFDSYSALSCYKLDGIQLYAHPTFGCQALGVKPVSIKTEKTNIILYKSSLHQVKINLPLHESCLLSVYTINGQKIISKEIPCNQYINAGIIKSGIYIFEVKTKNSIYREKAISF